MASQTRRNFVSIFYLQLVTKSMIERDRHIRCLYPVRIDTVRPRIFAICSIPWWCRAVELALMLAVWMRPMMFVVVLLIRPSELVMCFHLLFVAMANSCIVTLVKWVIAVRPLEHSLVNPVFGLQHIRILKRNYFHAITTAHAHTVEYDIDFLIRERERKKIIVKSGFFLIG